MGKYDSILLLATLMKVSDEDFTKAASQLDAIGSLKLDGSLTPKQIMDRIGKQIAINRLKAKINTCRKVVNSMPFIIAAFFIIADAYMMHH